MASSSAPGSEPPLKKEPFAHLVGKIPERSSSLAAQKHCDIARKVSGSLEKLRGNVKRKASELSLISNDPPARRKAAAEYLDAAIGQRKLIDAMNRESLQALALDFKSNRITQEKFETQMRELTRKQSKLWSGDVALKKERDRILAEVDDIAARAGNDEEELLISLTSYFYDLLVENKQRDRDAEQINWRMNVAKYYQCQLIQHGPVWCPITKFWGPYEDRKTAHLVPFKIGYETMGRLFNGEGYDLMWAMGNRLPMQRAFKNAYDRFDFCLLPRVHPGKPDEFQLVLINESLRNNYIYAGKKWDDYDGCFLEFPKGCEHRPQKRFLYFHYWMCIIKLYTELTTGWQEEREKTKMGRLWATPGPYLRKSMVKRLGELLGDHVLPGQDEVLQNSFEGSSIPADEQDTSVKEILAALVLPIEIEGVDEDDSDY